MSDYKTTLIRAISQSPYLSHSLLVLPKSKVASLAWQVDTAVQALVRIAEDTSSNSENTVNLHEILKEEPSKEHFNSEEDYLLAKETYNRLKAILNSLSSRNITLNTYDLEQIYRYLMNFDHLLHTISAIEGRRLKILITEKQEVALQGRKSVLSKMLSAEKED